MARRSSPLSQPSAGRLVPEVVPMEVDVGEMLAIDAAVGAGARGLEPVSEEHERLPSSSDGALVVAVAVPNTNAFGPRNRSATVTVSRPAVADRRLAAFSAR